MTKTEKLQKIWDDNKESCHYNFQIIWRGFGGWWAIPDEIRWWGDEGEFLGRSFVEAEVTLRSLL